MDDVNTQTGMHDEETHLRFVLKRATNAAHEALDGFVMGHDFFADRAMFARFLAAHRAMYRVYAPIEAAWNRSHGPLDWVLAGALDDLDRDLADLDWPPANDAAITGRFPEISDVAEFAGASYVVNGAHLGGLFLFRQNARTLGISEQNGGRYLSLHGRHPNTWRAYCDWLDGLALDAVSRARAVATADKLFVEYRSAFEQAVAI